jgi:phage-related baseplate assembly protein
MTVTTSVDLSRLPPPEVVETLAYEQIYSYMLADLVARDPTFTALVESDPVCISLQVAAYREMILRQRVNDAAKSVLLAYAVDGSLDNLAAFYGVSRLTLDPGDPSHAIPPTMESNDDLRRRCTLAPSGYSVAGPDDAYIFHALSASGSVLDAKPTSPSPGEVVVSVLARTGDGTAAPDLLATVAAALSSKTVRPLTDHVTVQSATIVPFAIAGTRYTFGGPDSGLVLAESDRRLAAYLDDARRLGRDIPLSALYAAMHCDGMQRIVLTSPAASIVIGDTQAAHCTSITLTYGGIDE